ncbi:MAG: hypothetical protein ACI87W_001885 [Halieaceae bacterium]
MGNARNAGPSSRSLELGRLLLFLRRQPLDRIRNGEAHQVTKFTGIKKIVTVLLAALKADVLLLLLLLLLLLRIGHRDHPAATAWTGVEISAVIGFADLRIDNQLLSQRIIEGRISGLRELDSLWGSTCQD